MTIPRMRNARLTGAGLLASALLAWVPSPAAAAVERLVAAGSGLTAPAGVVQTPDGAYWVADGNRGLCRVTPGETGGLREDQWCGSSHAGPVKASGVVFDAATENFYVGDGASQGGAVWRMHWDAGSKAVDAATPVVRTGGDRVTAVGLVPGAGTGAGADVLYATKESQAIMRIAASVGAPQPPRAVGFSAQPGAEAIAYLGGSIYLAEGADVMRVALAGDTGRSATRVAGLAGGHTAALAADPDRNRVYAGTSNGLDDHVFALDGATGAVVPYARGLAGISALAVGAAGDLLIADDAMVAAGAIDSEGHGRLWRVAVTPLARPSVRLTDAPRGVGSSAAVRFAYAADAGDLLECRLDGGGWVPCDAATPGEVAYSGLADGVHSFEIRAVRDGIAGETTRRVFVVDTAAPRAWVAPSAPGSFRHDAVVWLEALSDEPIVAFECTIDGAAPVPCDSRTRLEGLAPGAHEVRVTAIDAAGNASSGDAPASVWSFRVLAPPTPEPRPEVAGSAPAPAPVPAPVPVLTPLPTPPAAPAVGAWSDRSFVAGSLRLLPGSILLPRSGRRAPILRLELTVPEGAVRARLTLKTGRRHLVVKEFAVRPGANALNFWLTRAESRRLRVGRHRVAVVLRDAGGQRGPSRAHLLRVR